MREGERRLSLCCAAARAANVYNSKAQQRVAGEPAILKDVTRLEAIFYVQVLKIILIPNPVALNIKVEIIILIYQLNIIINFSIKAEACCKL